MFWQTVTELPRRLEPISRDTFNDAGRVPPAGRPSPSRPVALRDNVVQLRPAAVRRVAA